MRSLLLDTHVLLWFYGGSDELSTELRQRICNPATQCYVSIASLWEITIKCGIGKLDLGTSLEELFSFLDRNNFTVLAVDLAHLLQLNQLPAHHRDPFDRLIIAQALVEHIAVATRDALFRPYEVSIIW